jgi:hypothetical protein
MFGPELVSTRRIFAYTLLGFIALTLLTASFSYAKTTLSLGINTQPPGADISFGTLSANATREEVILVNNPTIVPTKYVAFTTGSIAKFVVAENRSGKLLPAEEREVTLFVKVPAGFEDVTEKHKGAIYIFSSPLWLIFPQNFLEFFGGLPPFVGISLMNILCSFFVALAIVLGMTGIEKLGERLTLWGIALRAMGVVKRLYPRRVPPKRRRITFKELLHRVFDVGWVDIGLARPLSASLIAIPFFVLIPFLAVGTLLGAIAAALFAYLALGCRWKAEVIVAGIFAELWALAHHAAIFVSTFETSEVFVPFVLYIAGLAALAFVILLVPVIFCSYLACYLVNKLRITIDPVVKILEYTDF